MKNLIGLLVVGLLCLSSQSLTIAQTAVTLTLYVHEGSPQGPVIPGARVTGRDAAGKSFDQTTNTAGYVMITGAPGTWSFTASKTGYKTVGWSQSITATSTKHAYLQKEQVTLTLYVREGSPTGPVLPGARVQGNDGTGNSFDQTTNSSGYVKITGVPGTWQFTVSKTGYQTNSWSQNITTTGEKHAYLVKELLPPSPPTPISPGSSSEPGPVIDTLTPTLQWSGVPNADYYALAISKYPYGSSNIVYNPQQLYGTSHTVPSSVLEPGQKYRWNMQTRNSAGWSSVSSTLYFQTRCTYSIPPTSQSFSSAGGSGTVSVTAGRGCSWTATSNDSWITITSGSSGSGNGTVNYSVAPNLTTSSRTGTMTIAGQTFTVTQEPPPQNPVLDVTPNSINFRGVRVGQCSATQNFTVRNTGGGTLSGNATTSVPFEITAGGSFNNLGAGQSHTVTVRFCPTITGQADGAVNFTSNIGEARRLVSGVGMDQPAAGNVTLTLYVHKGSDPQLIGPAFSGARVTSYDGASNHFDKTTNETGYVTISGVPGTWHFTASVSDPRYQVKRWPQSITETSTKRAFLKLAQCSDLPDRPPEIIEMIQAARYALDAGFKNEEAAIIVAIAWAESDPDGNIYSCLYNPNNDSWDRGILQINDSSWGKLVDDNCAFDPRCAFEKAREIYMQASKYRNNGFEEWEAYKNNSYNGYLSKAQEVVRSISEQPIYPSAIRSPIAGKLHLGSQNRCDSWSFWQHKTGGHTKGGGIGGADDTFAWDINLLDNADAGKPVYAVDHGKVVKYAGLVTPGGNYGAVLIEHNHNGTIWWSGYLHMKDIQVKEGDSVTPDTILGYISNASRDQIPDHLHFAVYKGENTQGKLESFDVTINARGSESYCVISGRVTSGGSGLAGVTVTLSGAASRTTTTDNNGNYNFSGLAPSSYTITPSRSGYTFNPASLPVTISSANVSGQDFTATATPTVRPPTAPDNLRVRVVSSRQIDLSWRDRSNNEDGFRIYRNDTPTPIATVRANATSYSDTTVRPRTFYCYQVAAHNAAGEARSSQVCRTTPRSFQIGALMVAGILTSIVPTFNGVEFAIDGQGISSAQLEVFDLRGRNVFDSGEVQGNTFTWSLQNNAGQWLANGVYLYVVRVRGFNGEEYMSEVRKLVILR